MADEVQVIVDIPVEPNAVDETSEEQSELTSEPLNPVEFCKPPYILACAFAEMNPKKRRNMEDVHRIVPSLDGDVTTSYFAVYDGHGGRGIVEFIETRLEVNIAQELRATDDSSIAERMARAFLITDLQSSELDTPSGATAVCCLLRSYPEGRVLYTANVGDSRAVLCQQGQAYRLSYDHKAEDPAEQQRVQNAGGFIQKKRVLGFLAITRSFGDHAMKDFVTCHPHITETHLDLCDCPFVILACDGVWDVLKDQEAVDLIMKRFEEEGPFDGAGRMLVDAAMERDSTDNITAVVVFL